jgi:orotate phosphoribosyltransferase
MLKVIDEVKGIDIVGLLKKSGAMMEGHFRLTSGFHSKYYLQCAKLLQYPDLTDKIVKAGLKSIDGSILDSIDTVISPAMGGILFGYMIAYNLKKRMIFTERKNEKMELRRGFKLSKGQRVLIAEDVITTGGSVKEVIDICLKAGADIKGIISLVDRSEDAAFGYPYNFMIKFEIEKYAPEKCPLCKQGIEMDYMGSKKIFK